MRGWIAAGLMPPATVTGAVCNGVDWTRSGPPLRSGNRTVLCVCAALWSMPPPRKVFMALDPVVTKTESVPPSVREADSRFAAEAVIAPNPEPTAFTTRVKVRVCPLAMFRVASWARATVPWPVMAGWVTVPSAKTKVDGGRPRRGSSAPIARP